MSKNQFGRPKPGSIAWPFILALTLFVVVAAFSTRAALVWDGPLIAYNQPPPNPAQATNQDRLTPDVWLTRAASKPEPCSWRVTTRRQERGVHAASSFKCLAAIEPQMVIQVEAASTPRPACGLLRHFAPNPNCMVTAKAGLLPTA